MPPRFPRQPRRLASGPASNADKKTYVNCRDHPAPSPRPLGGIKPEAVSADGSFDEPDLRIFHFRLDVAKRQYPARTYPDGVGLAAFASAQ